MDRATVLLAVVVALGSSVRAHAQATGFLDRQVTVEATAYRYQVFVLVAYTADRRWPVILFLHGAGERGSDGILQTEVGIGTALRREPGRFPAIVVLPQAPADTRWTGVPGDVAMAALDATLAEFSTDPDRVYLTGLSLGGQGTFYLAYAHPERFAAIVPICGFVAGNSRMPSFVPASDGSPYAALAERIHRLPIWIFHGEVDPVVPVTESRRVAEAMQAAGAAVTYTEIPGTGHNAWDPAYGSPALTDWLFRQHRP